MPGQLAPKSVGEMHKRLQVQVPPDWTPTQPGQNITTNEFNEVVLKDLRPTTDGFVTLYALWGEVTPLSGRELWLAQQIRPDITTRVTVRFWKGQPPFSPRMRFFIASDDRKLNVAFVLPGQRKRWQQLLCREEIA